MATTTWWSPAPTFPIEGFTCSRIPAIPKTPTFKPAVRIGEGLSNVRVTHVNGEPRVLSPGKEWVDFWGSGFETSIPAGDVDLQVGNGRTRADQRHYVDWNGDGKLDLAIGIGYWGDYGWDNAFDDRGNWTRGPLHGFVYIAQNVGTNDQPDYAEPQQLFAGGEPVDVYGMPSPSFADFDGDGDLDLLCGEFIDSLTYFENVGSHNAPELAAGRKILLAGEPLRMDLCMIVPTSIDWDRDGDVDLIVGQEDGRVALLEHLGTFDDGLPNFAEPVFFQQEATDVKFGALVTPVSFDWDHDGDEDIVAGNTAGYIGFIENLGMPTNGRTPKWAAPVRLQADGETLRIMAGENGSIQGPCESKWGYTTLSVADWDHDDLPDLIVNSIWGKIVWYRNIGTRSDPELAQAEPVTVDWGQQTPPQPAWNWWHPGPRELATQWRTTPLVTDWDRDGLNDLLMLDHEGYLALFRRKRDADLLVLTPGARIFLGQNYDSKHRPQASDGALLRLNVGLAGRSGRRKLCLIDWDGDGLDDLLANSENVNLLRQVRNQGNVTFEDLGPLSNRRLAGHTTSPTTVDWDSDGRPELLVGAEDGFLYYMPRMPSQ